MIRLYLKFIRWFTCSGIILWFLLTPMLPVYGLARPWLQANYALEKNGITGVPLMIGASSSSERVGDSWNKTRQRSYIVFPDSFRRMEIISYQISSSNSVAAEEEIIRSRFLIPFLVIWILAGVFSARLTLFRRKSTEPNQRLQTSRLDARSDAKVQGSAV